MCAGCSRNEPAPPQGGKTILAGTQSRHELLSKVYTVDRIYRSMKGPYENYAIKLVESAEPELLWITGCQAQVVAPDGITRLPDQYLCHANLDFNVQQHTQLFSYNKPLDGRMFTLSQGQLNVQFPDGFGIPVMSDEVLNLNTQLLNLNPADSQFDVRHKVNIQFVRDSETSVAMKPLYQVGAYAMVTLEKENMVYGEEETTHNDPNCRGCCTPGKMASESDSQSDALGRRFTAHWIVPPGLHENQTRVTSLLNLPFDTTAHFIAVHLHPFAQSLELRDATTGHVLFRSEAKNLEGQIGLSHVDSLSSVEGIPLYQGHEYEMVSVYNNTTDEDQDSMAVMYFYLLDKEFRRSEILSRSPVSADEPEISPPQG